MMMKTLNCLICLAVFSYLGETKEPFVVVDTGFETPESVEYDAQHDVYLVSNINGDPLSADGNGFISKLNPNGDVIALKWIDGSNEQTTLNAPKGIEIVNGKLFVTDLNTVRVFDSTSGVGLKNIEIEGSTFLNGICAADKNSVYVTDSGLKEGFKPSGTDAIYQVWADGKVTPILFDPELGHPNGIVQHEQKTFVVTFGSGDFFSLDSKAKKQMLPKPPQGNLDGLVQLPDGRLLFSSWAAASIYSFEADQSFKVFASELDAPADMGVDTKRNRLLVPLFKQNKLMFLDF